MRFIDFRTVILLTSIMCGLMSLVMYSLKQSYPANIKGLGQWSAGLLILFIASLLFTAQRQLPDLIAFPVANLLLWVGLYIIYNGCQHFFGVTPREGPWVVLFFFGLLVMLWFTVMDPSYHARLVFSAAVRALLLGMLAWLVFRQGVNTMARWLSMCALASASAVQLLRIATSFTYPLGTDIFDVEPHQLIYITSYAFLIFLFSISLILLASERLRTELEHLAHHDSLTNALTRRHMAEACQQELGRCHRHGRQMALLMLDLDHFKAVNDTFGHQTGDRVLIDFVSLVNALLRQADQLGRFGGEEFMLLLPETTLEEALFVANRIRIACVQSTKEPSYTVSIGVTTNHPGHDTLDALMARADAALYRAKADGRNRVESNV